MLIHPGRAVDQQCASSCVVWIVVAVHSEVVIFKQIQMTREGHVTGEKQTRNRQGPILAEAKRFIRSLSEEA